MKLIDPITLVIADDHPLFRSGLRDAILPHSHFHILADTGDGESALQLLRDLRPHIAVLDIQMPKMTGLDVARRIQQEGLPVLTIILTMFDDEDLFNTAMEHGVMGYILKESATLDIINGITLVARGEYYVSPRLTRHAGRAFSPAPRASGEDDLDSSLTPTEKKVLSLIARKKSTREIAETLFISYRTAEHHRGNICRKLNLSGSFSLLRYAIEHQSRIEKLAALP